RRGRRRVASGSSFRSRPGSVATTVARDRWEDAMSVLGRPVVAAAAARMLQGLVTATARPVGRRRAAVFPELPSHTTDLTIPTSVAPAPAVVYRPSGVRNAPVYVNFHGGGFVMRGTWLDDPLCRFLAAEAGVVVVNVDYVVAPR